MNESSVWPARVPRRWRLTQEDIYAGVRQSAAEAEPQPDSAPPATATVRSEYVAVRDGTRLAVDVWVPRGAEGAMPVVVLFTRYWRAESRDGSTRHYGGNAMAADLWNQAGYIYVVVDLRGTGASFGWRSSEYSEAEFHDYGDVIRWVRGQDWCDGFVATEGGSYSGNVAELASASAPGLVDAVIPRFTDFDSYQSIACPGGIPNLAVLLTWGAITHALDQSNAAVLAPVGDAVLARRQPMPVDNAEDLLQSAIAEHTNNFSNFEVAIGIEFADDAVAGAPSRAETSLYAKGDAVCAAGTPQFAWASWMDAATADGLISRFLTFEDLPIRALIGSWAHLGFQPGDPFGVQKGIPLDRLVSDCAGFLDDIRSGGEPAPRREIRYYTMGAERWSTTDVWPPHGTRDVTWRLGAGQVLSQSVMPSPFEERFESGPATSGTENRWHTQLGGGAVRYANMNADDNASTYFESEALVSPMEITGHPVVDLRLSLSSTDAALFAYLQLVLSDGTVLCIADGQLRAGFASESEPPPAYVAPGPNRQFRRQEYREAKPGQPLAVKFRLMPTSALAPVGSKIRLTLAGQDVDTFACFPDERPQTICIHHGSRLVLPVNEPDEGGVK